MVSDHRHYVIFPHVRNQANIHLDRNLVWEQSLCLRSRVAGCYAVDVEGGIKKILLQRFNTMGVADEPVDLHVLLDGGIVEGLLQLWEKLAVLLVRYLGVTVKV